MAMPSALLTPGATAQPIPSSMTLRALLDARRAEGRRISLEEAIAIVVPVCLDLRDRHARGEKLYVHPSAIAASPDGLARVQTELSVAPTRHDDKHCLAPELQRTLEPGDACASVFSLGAILYEMVTGRHIGPGMRRPRDYDAALPESLRSSSEKRSSVTARIAPRISLPSRARCTTLRHKRASILPK